MRPLIEELKDSFTNDCIAQQIFGNDFDSLFYMKNAEGEVDRSCADLYKDPCSENSVHRIKKEDDIMIMPEINICINIDRLRRDLKEDLYGAYYGGGSGGAMMQAMDLDSADPQKLVELALEKGIDLRKYEVQ